MNRDLTTKRSLPPFRLNGAEKLLLWSFAVPLILAVNCFLIRTYLEAEAEAQCPPPQPAVSPSKTGGYQFEIYSSHSGNILFTDELECASSQMEFFYKSLGIAALILICLSIALPFIIHLRRRSSLEPKLFEAD